MPDPQPIPIVEVTLPKAAQSHVKARKLNRAIASGKVPGGKEAARKEVGEWIAQLTQHQQELLLDALDHSLSDGHGANLSFSKQRVGYKLDGILLSVTDRTVSEESTTAPLGIRFIRTG